MTNKPQKTNEDQLSSLTDELIALRQEVQVLRNVLDEMREDVAWGIRNGVLPSANLIKPLKLTSLPLDPAVEDFHERVNEVTPEDLLDNIDSTTSADHRPASQKSFWSSDQ